MNITKVRESLLLGKTIHDLKLRVADYSRVSTDKNEQLNSLENQKNYFKELIKSNKNWIHVNSYIDEGICGTSALKRESFLKMIEDAKNNKIDLILTKEISRFSRNTIDSIKYTQKLLEYGVAVLFISDNINTIYPDSEFRLTIMASLAQDEVRKLSERVKFGIKRSIKDGKLSGSRITGYYKKDGYLTINKDEEPIIKKIFTLYATGQYSFKEISKELATSGYYTKKGKLYSDMTLKTILTNPRYKGYYTANLSQVIDYKTHKKTKIPKNNQIIYKDEKGVVPAIIDEKTWDKANEIYNKRKRHWNNINLNKEKYINNTIYTSKLICKEHNKPYIRASSGKRKNNPTWQCNEYLRHGLKACQSPIIKEKELNTILKNIIKEELDINKLNQELIKEYKQLAKNIDIPDEQESIKQNLISLLTRNIITEKEYLKEKEKLHKKNLPINIKQIEEKLNTYTIDNLYPNIFKILINKIIIEKVNNNRKNLRLSINFNYNHTKKVKLNIL